MVFRKRARGAAAHRYEPKVSHWPAPAAFACEPRAPAEGPALHARRERASLALWHPLAFPLSPRSSLHAVYDGKRISSGLRASRISYRDIWRKLELERAGLVPGEFFDHRVVAKISLLFWR